MTTEEATRETILSLTSEEEEAREDREEEWEEEWEEDRHWRDLSLRKGALLRPGKMFVTKSLTLLRSEKRPIS